MSISHVLLFFSKIVAAIVSLIPLPLSMSAIRRLITNETHAKCLYHPLVQMVAMFGVAYSSNGNASISALSVGIVCVCLYLGGYLFKIDTHHKKEIDTQDELDEPNSTLH